MVLTIGLTTITSCEAEDGNWSPVELTVNGSRYRKTVYKVPAKGGEYRLNSKNYGSLWLCCVYENDSRQWYAEAPAMQREGYESSWYRVYYDEDKNIVVSIDDKEEDEPERGFEIGMAIGDASTSLTLKQ